MIAEDLATEAQTGLRKAASDEDIFLRLRHPLRLAADELDAAGGAASVAAAGVELIDLGFILQGEDEALVIRDLDRRLTFNG